MDGLGFQMGKGGFRYHGDADLDNRPWTTQIETPKIRFTSKKGRS